MPRGGRHIAPRTRSTQRYVVKETNGMADSPPLVYVDANAFIYFLEGEEDVAKPILKLFSFLKNQRRTAVTSELTLAEVLPKARQREQRQVYLDLIVWSGICELQPVSRDILYETVDYRRSAATRLTGGQEIMPRLPDAIHVVTAVRSGCSRILSADARMRLPDGMARVDPNENAVAVLMRELS